ncbi:signal peptidase I, bacterial type [Gottschalkia purinilytica]|uniref:Signal peptidase I n=1 Tax=Gottschalkia purinilytica TaxID=1503 RepID=A0A0L0WDA7_GOTPU|nr:signal peptidase I [Gottschalkia purinilytica]KNF09452.1 signal peptidase I, bacterial type [Gottschalkia purinilytica]
MKSEILEWIKCIVISVGIAFAITSFINTTEVYSVSMNPTLVEHDRLVILNNNKNIKHGDIIVFKTDLEFNEGELKSLNIIQRLTSGSTKKLIKRVIGLEGDKITIKNGKVYVNDKELDENYIKEYGTIGDVEIDKIPKGKVFVMGDNRNNSIDSRSEEIGLVDYDKIVGKVIYRIYPFSKVGKLN